MIEILKALKTEFKDINYEFDNWNSDLKLPYFVGEIYELNNPNEYGKREFEFMLTGEDVETYTNLINVSESIKDKYKHGFKIKLDNGIMNILYDNILFIPVEAENLKRIQINMSISLWEDK